MKIKLLFLFTCMVSLFTACKKDSDTVQPISLTINSSIDESEVSGITTKNALIKISNTSTGQEYSATADEHGKVNFSSILPGNYAINATLLVSAVDFTSATGIYSEADVAFNATLTQTFFETGNVDLKLKSGKIGNWVIKQLYYVGSDTKNGAIFRDTFIEFYNNSNETLYADSLYFGQAEGKNNTRTGDFLLSNLQYDWAKALNMNVGNLNANQDFIYANTLFMIPSDGTGKKYPVLPGESFIVASNAVNHQSSYKLNTQSGEIQVINNPALTIDLSKANFETYLVDYLRSVSVGNFTPYKFDVDNPEVPNVDVVYFVSGNDMIFDGAGREAVFLLSTSGTKEDPRKWAEYYTPDVREATANKKKFLQIPTKHILDAVELQHPLISSRVPKRLPESIDAGRTQVSGGAYSSQSIVRKTAKTVNGRRILMDTNNSTNDFGQLTKADPSKSASSFID